MCADFASSRLPHGSPRTRRRWQQAARNFGGKLHHGGFHLAPCSSQFHSDSILRRAYLRRSLVARVLQLRRTLIEQLLSRGFLLGVHLTARGRQVGSRAALPPHRSVRWASSRRFETYFIASAAPLRQRSRTAKRLLWVYQRLPIIASYELPSLFQPFSRRRGFHNRSNTFRHGCVIRKVPSYRTHT